MYIYKKSSINCNSESVRNRVTWFLTLSTGLVSSDYDRISVTIKRNYRCRYVRSLFHNLNKNFTHLNLWINSFLSPLNPTSLPIVRKIVNPCRSHLMSIVQFLLIECRIYIYPVSHGSRLESNLSLLLNHLLFFLMYAFMLYYLTCTASNFVTNAQHSPILYRLCL